MKKSDMKKAKNNDTTKVSFFKKAKPFLIVIAIIITLPITIPAIIWLGLKAYDLLFNWDLRAKKSYQREITVNFEYEGKDYTMKPIVKCINKGTAINEGNMRWYIEWEGSFKNNRINLGNGVMARLNDFVLSACELVRDGNENAKKIELISIVNKDNNHSIKVYKDIKYYSETYRKGVIAMRGVSEFQMPNNEPYRYIEGVDFDLWKKLDVKIKSYQIGEKKLINN